MNISRNCIVTLRYRITDAHGKPIDEGDEPFTYLHGGYGQIFAPVERALEGKQEGETFRVDVAAAEAFGEDDPQLRISESLTELPDDLEVGMEIDGYFEERPEETILYRVVEIDETTALLDGNHPLAGTDIVFEGSVLEVLEADDETIQTILEHQHDDDHHH